VAFLASIRDGWVPERITEEQYHQVKGHRDLYTPEYLAYVGYGCSFGGMWFGTFARSEGRDIPAETIRNIQRQAPKLRGAEFVHSGYDKLTIPKGSLIYCDPPYEGTTGYKMGFDHGKFWQWCRDMSEEGHVVIVSEYTAPEDFQCIFELGRKVRLSGNTVRKQTEKLFTLRYIYEDLSLLSN
jgi:DNA adenine methylase